MDDRFVVVIIKKSLNEYANNLSKLIKEKGYQVVTQTLSDYQKTKSLSFISNEFEKYIFLGSFSNGKPYISDIKAWKYNRFASKIGFNNNHCEIIANDRNLPFAEYKEFMDYCRGMQLEYSDVIVPEIKPIFEQAEEVKNLFGIKKNRSILNAQYSTVIYEFVNHYLDDFFNLKCEYDSNNHDGVSKKQLNDYLNVIKENALETLDFKQAALCHVVIHTAAIACAGISFIPLPSADVIPMTATQITMVIALGNIFSCKLSKSDAEIILKTVSAPLIGRAIAKNFLIFMPGIGWAINGAVAGLITEILGWIIANDFALKKENNLENRDTRESIL